MYIDWPKINSIISVKKIKHPYLFFEQFEKIKDICNDVVSKREESFYDESIIGIAGERGSGKSSLLRTVKNNLDGHYVLETIDPSVFDDSMSIIELFISTLYKELTLKEEKITDYDLAARIHNKLKSITKLLSDFKAGNESFYRDTAYSDVLDSIKQRVELSSQIKNLVEDFLKYVSIGKDVKYKSIVLCIDDVDLVSNDKIFSLLEDVRKNLAGNIIVITAFNSSQLFDAVLNEKLKENKNLLEKNLISLGNIKEQVARYIEKLIPIHNQVKLPDSDNLLDISFSQILRSLVIIEENDISVNEYLFEECRKRNIPFSEFISVKEWLYETINRRTRLKIKPIDMREYTSYNLPKNLRGLMQLIRLLFAEMDRVDLFKTSDNPTIENFQASSCAILKNLMIYRGYIQKNQRENLSVKYHNIIELWEKCDYTAKNYYICTEIMKIINETNKEVLANKPKYILYSVYHVTVGDVHQVLDIFKNSDAIDEEGRYFLFCVKILYSIELLTNYLKASLYFSGKDGNNDMGEQYLAIYLTLINAKIIHEGYSYYSEIGEGVWGIKYQRSKDRSDGSISIYSKLLYSAEAVKGDLRKNSPKYPDNYPIDLFDNSSGKNKKYISFKSRRLYETDVDSIRDELRENSSYPIDPYAFIVQRYYVEHNFYKNAYIFYSLFDIDAIYDLHYSRGEPASSGNKTQFIKLIDKVDEIIMRKGTRNVKKSQKRHDEMIKQSMVDSVFYESECISDRIPVFSEEEKKQIDNITFELFEPSKEQRKKIKENNNI